MMQIFPFAPFQAHFTDTASTAGNPPEAAAEPDEDDDGTEPGEAPDSSRAGASAETQAQNEVVQAQAKATEAHDRMLRIAAEFENAKKRWEKERLDVRQYSIQEFARDLLPVIDAFDKAIHAIEESQINFDNEEGKKLGAIIEGVQLASKVFHDSMKKHGIERLPGRGEPFNPAYHNAVAKVVDEQATQETVIDEFIPGYKIGDRVLRTAMVRVASPD